ncbi:MAG: EpsG family protein [Bacteroidales bacterium]|nr:EpsG family protein [Bacteroidales bacterium]
MIPYLLIFLFVLLFTSYDVRETEISSNQRNIFVFLIALVLSLFVGLRDMIGGYDVYIYGEIFDITPAITSFDSFMKIVRGEDTSLPQILEPGFLAFGGIVKLFDDSRYTFFLILSVLSYMLIFKAFNKYMPFVFLAIFIFSCKFTLMSFVYVRQMLAMSIVWAAIPYIINRDIIKFFLLMLIAFLIHNSSLIFLPLYFLGLNTYKKPVILIALIGSFVLGLTTSFFSSALGTVGEAMDLEKASVYANVSGGDVNIYYAIEAAIIGIGLYFTREKFYSSKISTLFFNIAICYVCSTFITMRDATGVRLVWYFMIGMVYAVSSLAYCFKDSPALRNAVLVTIFIYFSALHFRLLMIWDSGDMMPYQTFLSDTQRPTIWTDREYTLKYAKPQQIQQQ